MNNAKRERFEELLESDQNDAAVQYEIGRCYLYGEGVEQDGQTAEKWLRRAAEQDYPEAKELLESVRAKRETPAALTEASLPDWCMRAEAGDAEAQYQVARYFQEHQVEGGTEDTERYLAMAVEQGHPEACLLLAKRKLEQRDYAGAVAHLRNAADCGLSEAAELLGWCYSRGEGVNADLAQAEEWFTQAAQLGGPAKMVEIAVRYTLGDGIPASYGKAMSWLKRAEEGGLTDARKQFDTCCQARRDALLRQREEEAKRRKAEEAQRQQQAAARRIRQKEEAQRRKEEEAQRQQQAEAQRRKAEEARRQQQAEAQRRKAEEARRQQQAEAQRRKAEEAQRQQAEAQRRQQEERRQKAAGKKAGSHKTGKIIALVCVLLLAVKGIQFAYVHVFKDLIDNVESLLEERTVDVFKDLDVVFYGIAPCGEVDLLNNSTDPFIQTVTYSAEPADGLSVGDQVVVTAYFDEDTAKEAGCKIKKVTNTYTVEGLDSYVASVDQIDEACLAAMEQQARDMVEAKLANYSKSALSADFGGPGFYVKSATPGAIAQETAYFLTLKNGYDFTDYDANRYIITYRVPVSFEYSYSADRTATGYFSVVFYDLTVSPEGVTSVSLPNADLKDPVTSMDTVYKNCASAYKDTYIVKEIASETAAPEPPAAEPAPDAAETAPDTSVEPSGELVPGVPDASAEPTGETAPDAPDEDAPDETAGASSGAEAAA